MTSDESKAIARQYAQNLARMKKLSYDYFPEEALENPDSATSYGTAATKIKQSFHKVRGAKPKHLHFYSTSMQSTVGPTQSQIERIEMLRMLEENKLSFSEKNYFKEKVQRKVREFKQKATSISLNMQKKLDRTGVFPHEVNHLRSTSMQTVVLRNLMVKCLPEYVSRVRQEIKELRNGQSIRVITALDKASLEIQEKEQRQELLVRLKKAVTNQVGEQSTKRAATDDSDTNLAGKLAHIINDKLPQRRVKPFEMKMQFKQANY